MSRVDMGRYGSVYIPLALLLMTAAPAAAQTWPRDVTGEPAAQCAFLNALGAPELCSPTNPLPVAAAGSELGGGNTTASGGRNWILADPPDYNPFARFDFPAFPSIPPIPYCFFLDAINIQCFGRAVPTIAGTVIQYRSNDGGQRFVPTAQASGVFGGGVFTDLNGVQVLPTGGYIFIDTRSGNCAATSPFYTTADGITTTNRTCTGTSGGVYQPSEVNVSTVLAPNGTVGGMCRTANSGASWTCDTNPLTISGYTGTGAWRWQGLPNGPQIFAAVTASTWIAIGNDSNDGRHRVIRSTNDGVSWTQVFDTGVTGGFPAVKCLTSTLCLGTVGQRAFRSSNAGATWTTVITTGPSGANTRWQAIAAFDSLTASLLPWGAGNGSGFGNVANTVDGGVTWTFTNLQGGTNGTCPNAGGAEQGAQSVQTRSGRGFYLSNYGAFTSPFFNCAHYSSLGTGGSVVVGPLGTAWNIDVEGSGPVKHGNTNNTFSVTPSQGTNLFNSLTTGAANTAVTVTLTALAGLRNRVHRIEANCAPAGTSSLTLTDNAVSVWNTLAAEVGTARFRYAFTPSAYTGGTGTQLVITLAACGAGNTGTLIVHADRF